MLELSFHNKKWVVLEKLNQTKKTSDTWTKNIMCRIPLLRKKPKSAH